MLQSARCSASAPSPSPKKHTSDWDDQFVLRSLPIAGQYIRDKCACLWHEMDDATDCSPAAAAGIRILGAFSLAPLEAEREREGESCWKLGGIFRSSLAVDWGCLLYAEGLVTQSFLSWQMPRGNLAPLAAGWWFYLLTKELAHSLCIRVLAPEWLCFSPVGRREVATAVYNGA